MINNNTHKTCTIRDGEMDRRIRKTKNAIYEALLKLAAVIPIGEITISQLCREADINRATFYTYYRNVLDVLEEIEDDQIQEFDEIMSGYSLKEIVEDPYELLNQFNKMILNEAEKYLPLIVKERRNRFTEKIVSKLSNHYSEEIKGVSDLSDAQIKIVLRFTFTGTMGVYTDWLDSDDDTPLYDITDTIADVLINGLRGLLYN